MDRVPDGELLDDSVLAVLRECAVPDAPDPAREVAATFRSVTPGRLARLRSAVGEGNTEEMRRIAHQVRGSCGVVGAMAMQRLASEIESLELTADAAPLVEQLQVLFARTRARLEAAV